MKKILMSLLLAFHLTIVSPNLVKAQNIVTYQTESASLQERRLKGSILIDELRATRRIIRLQQHLSQDKDIYILTEGLIDANGTAILVYYYITITDTEISLKMETY